ncbi:MAG: hypothetical protein IPK67_06605 [Planctomycetes bacterium]|nr:hypothetical protein [Planctomycetota bacterium]
MGIGLCLCGLGALLVASTGGGTETCGDCGARREGRRVGPLWLHGSADVKHRAPWQAKGIDVCADHDWRRTGCWNLGGIWRMHAPVEPPGP